MDWISTKKKTPKRKDAGYFRDVLVIQNWKYRDGSIEIYPVIVPFHLVRKTRHSHWAQIPPPPEEE